MNIDKCDYCGASAYDFASGVKFELRPCRFSEKDGKSVIGHVCPTCNAKRIEKDLLELAHGEWYGLYVTEECLPTFMRTQGNTYRPAKITDWQGDFVVTDRDTHIEYKYSHHNFAGRNGRLDVWFTHKGQRFHGVNIGDGQYLRVQRLKNMRKGV